jgi:glutamate carboxypeptidase
LSDLTESSPVPGLDPSGLNRWMADRVDEMVEKTISLASIESPSGEAGAQEPAREWLASEFGELGFEVSRLPGEGGCDHLLATLPGVSEGPSQLLLGHFDTVWPVGTLSSMPLEVRDGRLHGPGVFDMKGGIVQMLFALRAVREMGLDLPVPPVVQLVADEEVGSPSSRAYTEARAAGAARVFVMEPSYGPSGDLKTGRKGVGHFRLVVKGVASHAGLDPEGGVSAILEASRQIERLFELNDPGRGITVNVGTIDGGLRANVIAPEATAEIETRVATAADAEAVQRAILGLEPTRDRIEIEVTGGFGRPPMEKTPGNEELWEKARATAMVLGIEIDEAQVGGASDGNLTSLLAPTLDGLGAVGDGAHADHEHLVVEKMPERAALLAALLASPVV